MERLKIELEFEKRKLETLARELKMELDSVKMLYDSCELFNFIVWIFDNFRELEATVNTKQKLEDEKLKLSSTNQQLQFSLQVR